MSTQRGCKVATTAAVDEIPGSDTYRFGGDWDVDTLEDSDGQGAIEANGQILTGGKAVSANAWQSDDKQWRYALTEQDDLVITSASQAGRIVVHGWSRMRGRMTRQGCMRRAAHTIYSGVIKHCWISAGDRFNHKKHPAEATS